MSQLPRYESYKESGVQWLGEIPSHWKLIKNKFIFKFSKGLTITKENLIDEGIPCVSYGEVHSKYGFEVDPLKHDLKGVPEIYLETDPNALLKKGDFIFADTSEDIKGSGNFTYLNSDVPTFAGYHTVTAKMSICNNPRYLAYVFESDAHRNQVRTLIKGVKVFSITQAILKNTFVWLPSLDEQKIIVDFLDKRLAQVDALIAKQETLLEKLAEQRVALISHAVTKGLNPDVEMKETGISWFKQIPKSWDIKQLKFVITKIQTGSTPPSAVPEYYSSDDIVWYGPADFTDENYILNESVKKISALALEDKVVKPMPKGSIMMIGIGATLGKVAITNVDCTTNQQINSLISIEDVNAKYLMYQLNSLRDIVKLLSSASTLGIINQEKTKCLKIIVPSLNDQIEIVEFLDKELNEISAVKKSVEQTINKLKEYRSTLITQVVTGKMDVRNLKVN